MTSPERKLEEDLISRLKELKYTCREDIHDRANLVSMAPSSPLIY